MDIELSFSVSSYLIYAVFILDRCDHCFVPLSACHMSQSQVTNVHVQYKVHVHQYSMMYDDIYYVICIHVCHTMSCIFVEY